MSKIYPVILSGGSGKRLWPLSTIDRPKQFHALYSELPIIVETAKRFEGDAYAAPLIICNNAHRFHVATAFEDAGIKPLDIILEPEAKNTAAAIATAAHYVRSIDLDGVMLILPADHYINDINALNKAVKEAQTICGEKTILSFGIAPDKPETGYGYIHAGAQFVGDICKIESFKEKPDVDTAQSYLDAGGYYWNAGIFMGTVDAFKTAFETRAADVWAATDKAFQTSNRDLDFIRLDENAFATAPSISFDYAVMEKYDDIVVKPLDIGWNDIGSWSALWDIADKDANGNVTIGDVISQNCKNSYLRSNNDRSVVALGLQDLIVVSSQNAVTIAHKDHAQDIGAIYQTLIDNNCPSIYSTIKRQPWGYARTLIQRDQFTAKEIHLDPHEKTAVQLHHNRSEHWVIIEGTATISRDNDIFELHAGQSISIPMNTGHQIENKTDDPLVIFEVQSGEVSEGDVVRLAIV